MLGLFSAIGLLGFIATFVLIVMRSPATPVQRALTEAEVKSLTGPPGERGPAGPPGVARRCRRSRPSDRPERMRHRATAPSSAPTTRRC